METAPCPDSLSVIYTAVLYGSLYSPSYRRLCKTRSQTAIGLLGLDGCLTDSKRAGEQLCFWKLWCWACLRHPHTAGTHPFPLSPLPRQWIVTLEWILSGKVGLDVKFLILAVSCMKTDHATFVALLLFYIICGIFEKLTQCLLDGLP